MRNLGVLYEEGRGKRQSFDKAAKWYRRAAEQGDVLAQHNLAMMYTEGKGVPEDDNEAAHWLRRAADGGDSLSQIALALHYNVGLGVPQDPVQAYFWLGVAAKAAPNQGPERERVTFLRKTVARTLSPQQISEADLRARSWKPTGPAG
jgi:TPR repeat protein